MAEGLKGSTLCDSDSDDGGMFGFSSSDVEELLCQGIKPWDDEAAYALAVLKGDDFFYWCQRVASDICDEQSMAFC